MIGMWLYRAVRSTVLSVVELDDGLAAQAFADYIRDTSRSSDRVCIAHSFSNDVSHVHTYYTQGPQPCASSAIFLG